MNNQLAKMRQDSDWEEVFKYANPESIKTGAVMGGNVSTAPFGIKDVAEVLCSANGQPDGDSWVAVLRLDDGRFACIRASCDYTGWG